MGGQTLFQPEEMELLQHNKRIILTIAQSYHLKYWLLNKLIKQCKCEQKKGKMPDCIRIQTNFIILPTACFF